MATRTGAFVALLLCGVALASTTPAEKALARARRFEEAGQFAEAADAYERAAELIEASADHRRDDVFDARSAAGRLHGLAGNFPHALAQSELALELAVADNLGLERVVSTRLRIVSVFSNLGAPSRAQDEACRLESLADRNEGLVPDALWIQVQLVCAATHSAVGSMPEARDRVRKAHARIRERGLSKSAQRQAYALSFRVLASMNFRVGEYETAVKSANSSMSKIDKDDTLGRLFALTARGLSRVRIGESAAGVRDLTAATKLSSALPRSLQKHGFAARLELFRIIRTGRERISLGVDAATIQRFSLTLPESHPDRILCAIRIAERKSSRGEHDEAIAGLTEAFANAHAAHGSSLRVTVEACIALAKAHQRAGNSGSSRQFGALARRYLGRQVGLRARAFLELDRLLALDTPGGATTESQSPK